VQFNISIGALQNAAYHPRITISGTESGLVFDVTSDCSSAISCADDGSAGLSTTWEMFYNNDPPGLDLPANNTWSPPNWPANGVVYVKVYRSATSSTPTSCAQDTFTITAAN